MKPPVFWGQIKDGKLTIENKDQYDLWISSLEGDVRVDIKVSKMTRSDRQRRYYFVEIVKNLIYPLGVADEDEANEWLKDHFNNRIIKVRGEETEIGMSIEAEKTDKVEEIYRKIRQWASRELGVFLREPNEEDYY